MYRGTQRRREGEAYSTGRAASIASDCATVAVSMRALTRRCSTVLFATLLAASLAAPAAASPQPAETAAKLAPAPQRLPWPDHWPKIRWWEYAIAGSAAGILAYVQFGMHTSFRPQWEGGILFDEGARDALRLDSPEGRSTARTLSNVFWGIAWGIPLIDMVAIPALDKNFTLFWQLGWMNGMVFAIVGAASRAMHKMTKRARPLLRGCEAEGWSYDPGCSGSPSDFFSGHTAMAAAAAGLTCVHHQFLPLYGRRWADITACATASTAAAAVGLSRIMADRHWTSSVLVGYAFGFAVGYGLPRLLHYRRPSRWTLRSRGEAKKRGRAQASAGFSAMVTPLAGEQLGLQLVGMF